MINYFVRHPTAANLLMLVFILVGLLGISGLQREVFPEFASDYINVQVVYRGASADEVEQTICRRIEEELEGVEGIEEVVSTAREGLAYLLVEVADGYAVGEVLDDVENAVDQIDNFPEEAEDPVVWQFDSVDPVCTLTLWAERMPPKDLVALAEQVRRELLDLDGVSLVKLSGFSDHQIRIEVREEELLAHGLSIADVAREIQSQSFDLPAGSIETRQREIKVRVTDQRYWAEDFRDLSVKVSPAGARIPLRAVATVTDTFRDEWVRSTFLDREAAGAARPDGEAAPSVNLEIQKTSAEDTISVANVVRRFVDQRRLTLPDGVRLTMWGDWSFYVKDRLGMLLKNGILGFILVFFTLWFMLHVRLSGWVAAGIPISFMGTLFVMHQVGMSLNMITMFSLILALGIIVDDAIVIGENIFAHYANGETPSEAAVAGVREVALGVIASMATTVAVFLPLMGMTGQIGKVLRVMPLGVIVALAVSLIEAFLILPHHLKHSLAQISDRPTRVRAAINRAMAWMTESVYGPLILFSARRPLLPLAGVVMLLLISVGLLRGGRLKFQLFPELDGDFVVAQLELPNGATLEQTREAVRRIERALGRVEEQFAPQPGGRKLVRYVSTSYGFIRTLGDRPEQPETGSHLAQVIVELLRADLRTANCDDILAVWSKETGDIPDVVRLTFDQLQVTPGGKPVDIQLRGRDWRELQAASLELQERVKTYPGIYNVTDNLRPGKEEIRVRLKPAGRHLGITSASLAAQLRAAFWGSIAEEFQRGTDNVEVEVRFAPGDRLSLADLDDFKLLVPDGRMVPFHEAAEAEPYRGLAQIVRVDGHRSVSVTADLHTTQGNAAEIMDDLETNFFGQLVKRHPGVRIYLEGQRKETRETMVSVLRGFAMGLCVIYLLLSFIFKSYVEPLIVMGAIPFALVGAVLGHLVMGLDWTMPSTIGFVSLSGIVVNDSIVLVAFIKLRLAEGKGLVDALHIAGMQRFRPVLLTSATTVAGLLPIILETSLQAQILIPMAVSISFGLLFSTVLVLVLVPSEYGLLAWLGWTQRIAREMETAGQAALGAGATAAPETGTASEAGEAGQGAGGPND